MTTAFGASLIAYWNGDNKAKHIIERDNGYKDEIFVEYLFKPKNE
ncbi:MAG: hypothetical protein ACFFDT_01005 [Candidatus Hodarchaeota archaeon]